jgi:hypothetical protein
MENNMTDIINHKMEASDNNTYPIIAFTCPICGRTLSINFDTGETVIWVFGDPTARHSGAITGNMAAAVE